MNFKKNNSSISVFALCDVFYDAYYIQGLQDFFQTKKIKFTLDGFPKFGQGTFAVILTDGDSVTRIIIDSRDATSMLREQLVWCDVYGKVNYLSAEIPTEFIAKVFPIGPSFGIKLWNLPQTFYFAIAHSAKFYKFISNRREFMANYWRQFKRLRIAAYKSEASSNKYIFFIGTIWKNEKETNLYRSYFISACQRIENLKFEGGFAPRKDGKNLGFESLLTKKRYPFKEYLDKIKKSAVVFNTPAVLSCHGWKLGEFLAMGKAIISTEHKNKLPSPLVGNFHVEYVFPELSNIEKSINKIMDNENHRKLLEINARTYYETHLAPQKVIETLYNAAK